MLVKELDSPVFSEKPRTLSLRGQAEKGSNGVSEKEKTWIPAFAGMTEEMSEDDPVHLTINRVSRYTRDLRPLTMFISLPSISSTRLSAGSDANYVQSALVLD